MLREHFVKRYIIRIKIYSKNTLKVASNDSCSFPLQLGSSTRAMHIARPGHIAAFVVNRCLFPSLPNLYEKFTIVLVNPNTKMAANRQAQLGQYRWSIMISKQIY